jgi:RNA 2',3'-cyclic 3'-phosphodiesterase
MEDPIRAFIAIKMSGQLRNVLTLVGLQLIKGGINDVRWAKPENIHLTLQFLGDIPVSKIDDINTVIKKAAKQCSPFVLHIGGIGVFPNLRKPRVIWVGVDTSPKLTGLHGNLEEGLDKIGFQGDGRKLNPHLTIGRFKRNISQQSVQILGDLLLRNEIPIVAEQMVESIHLIKSELRSEGPIYSTLKTVIL